MDAGTLEAGLHRRMTEVLERCTACGACAEVCPMPAPAGLAASLPGAGSTQRSSSGCAAVSRAFASLSR